MLNNYAKRPKPLIDKYHVFVIYATKYKIWEICNRNKANCQQFITLLKNVVINIFRSGVLRVWGEKHTKLLSSKMYVKSFYFLPHRTLPLKMSQLFFEKFFEINLNNNRSLLIY